MHVRIPTWLRQVLEIALWEQKNIQFFPSLFFRESAALATAHGLLLVRGKTFDMLACVDLAYIVLRDAHMSGEVSVGSKSNAAPATVDWHCMASVDMFSGRHLLASRPLVFGGHPQTLRDESLAILDLGMSARNDMTMGRFGKTDQQVCGAFFVLMAAGRLPRHRWARSAL